MGEVKATFVHEGKPYEFVAHGKWMNVMYCSDCKASWPLNRKFKNNQDVCPECASSDVLSVKGRWNTYASVVPWWKIFTPSSYLIVPELFDGEINGN